MTERHALASVADKVHHGARRDLITKHALDEGVLRDLEVLSALGNVRQTAQSLGSGTLWWYQSRRQDTDFSQQTQGFVVLPVASLRARHCTN